MIYLLQSFEKFTWNKYIFIYEYMYFKICNVLLIRFSLLDYILISLFLANRDMAAL